MHVSNWHAQNWVHQHGQAACVTHPATGDMVPSAKRRACSLSMAFSGSERTSGMVEPAIRWNSDRMSDADLHAHSKLLSKCGDSTAA